MTSDTYQMSTRTGMAIDAFRAVEAKKRQLFNAEAVLTEAMRLADPEEETLYFLYTEEIRIEFDRRQADGDPAWKPRQPKDRDVVAECERQLVEIRDAIKKEEARLAAAGIQAVKDAAGVVPRGEDKPRAEDVIRKGR